MARTAFAGERLPRSPFLSSILLTIVLIAWVGPALSAPVQVGAIRHGSGAEHTRVVLDLSAKPIFRDRRTADPPTVTLEIENAAFATGIGNQVIGDGRLREVRVESPAGAPARVSFLLEGKRAVKVFMLGPAPGKPHRLVVDILGAPLPASARASAPPESPSSPAAQPADTAAAAEGAPTSDAGKVQVQV